MKIIAYIPSRGGSKRIPKKNTRNFLGKPMLSYPIESLKKISNLTDIYVSTDCEVAKEIANKHCCLIHKRKKDLCDDYVTTIECAKSFSEEINFSYDYLIMVYPTTPKLDLDSLNQAILKLNKSKNKFCALSVVRYSHPIQRGFEIVDSKIVAENSYAESRTQDLVDFYHDAANFYIFKPDFFNGGNSIFSDISIPCIISRYFAIDIDTPEDWDYAEKISK